MVEGEEAVVATKLTGDPNVPAGSPSFRAKVRERQGIKLAQSVCRFALFLLSQGMGEAGYQAACRLALVPS